MKHGEKVAPIMAAVTSVATIACCLPVGFAAAAYQPWFLGASVLPLLVGAVQLRRTQRACGTRSYSSLIVFGFSAVIVDWDPNHLLATQMKQDARAPQPVQDCCIRSGILWDLAAVYPPGATWSDRMPPATVFDGPVVDVTDPMEGALGSRASGVRRSDGASPSVEPNTNRLVFLTRGGCANTAVMRRNLDAALKSLGVAFTYDVVDQDTLPAADVRCGYPTPTLLYENRDVFGMSVPKPPLPDPT